MAVLYVGSPGLFGESKSMGVWLRVPWRSEARSGDVVWLFTDIVFCTHKLADATGSEQLAADFLGVDIPEGTTVPTPTVTLPTTGGGQ